MTAEELIAELEKLPNWEIKIRTKYNFHKINNITTEKEYKTIVINTIRLWENDDSKRIDN